MPRPAFRGADESLLDSVLGEVEVAEDAAEDRDRARPLVAVGADEFLYAETSADRMTTGRTSMWPIRADGIFAAHSIASSSVSTSTR